MKKFVHHRHFKSLISGKSMADCNHCGSNCKGRDSIVALDCSVWVDPRGTFKLAELALAHPQSLHEALVSLPFNVNLNFVLR